MGDNKKIIAFLKTRAEGATLTEISEKTGHGRATISKYLEMLKLEGRADYKGVGRAKLWSLKNVQKPKILVIDDEPGLRKLLKLALGEKSFEILEAADGLEGLEAVKREMPDLIILDIMLPKMDGKEVCRRLKENVLTRDIPIIMLTAREELKERVDGIKLGADDYISKPFDIIELKERVKSFLYKASDRNPITNLPGPKLVREALKKGLILDQNIKALRIGFANLDIYREKYGKVKENEFLKIAAQMITHTTLPKNNDYIGHISDTEFLIITDKSNIDEMITNMEEYLDEILPYIQSPKDQDRIRLDIEKLTARKDIVSLLGG